MVSKFGLEKWNVVKEELDVKKMKNHLLETTKDLLYY